jgi:hypothetical protein
VRIVSYNTSSEQIYQAVIWKRATTPIIDAPSPTDHGWKIDEERNIDVVWMTKKCAPDVLLKDCNCKCKSYRLFNLKILL